MTAQSSPERLQKYLARCGVASRRKAETLITAGRVAVNGKIVRQLGSLVIDSDAIIVDGKPVKPARQLVYYALNKPKGIITSSADEQGRKTVTQLVPSTPRVVACGRLDAGSRGLVILTNDGELCNQLTHPKFGHEKEYMVVATINKGPAIEERLKRLEDGVDLEDGKTAPAQVMDVKRAGMRVSFRIVLREGKNRQVRRMCSAVGLDVVDLVRTRIGGIALDNLIEGRWRPVKREEFEAKGGKETHPLPD